MLLLRRGACCTNTSGRRGSCITQVDFYRLWCFDVRVLDVAYLLLQQVNPTYLEGAIDRNMYMAFETKMMIILCDALLRDNVDFAGSTGTQHTASLPGGSISAWDATAEWYYQAV